MTKKKGYHLKLIEHDVENIKILALQKGLPYQTHHSPSSNQTN
ncbi:conserved hypothetical protein [Isorropodon fossajaponicum endosymbiont JTNG4]|nr:conserved hypothetical protein [Isorropodon fossajaponicum endosymbiont JTNG4]